MAGSWSPLSVANLVNASLHDVPIPSQRAEYFVSYNGDWLGAAGDTAGRVRLNADATADYNGWFHYSGNGAGHATANVPIHAGIEVAQGAETRHVEGFFHMTKRGNFWLIRGGYCLFRPSDGDKFLADFMYRKQLNATLAAINFVWSNGGAARFSGRVSVHHTDD